MKKWETARRRMLSKDAVLGVALKSLMTKALMLQVKHSAANSSHKVPKKFGIDIEATLANPREKIVSIYIFQYYFFWPLLRDGLFNLQLKHCHD